MENYGNPWLYDREMRDFVLMVPSPNVEYWYNINRCTTSAQILDHIVQIANKPWASDEIVAGFVHKVNEVLSLQNNMCGYGIEHGPIDVDKILKEKNLW